jgi:PPOX class probable F420-dependent enzyme
MDERARSFLADHTAAAMTTLRADGTPHSVRVGIALIDGKIWSSGTQTRVRTKHLRRDPRSTLFVYSTDLNDYQYLGLECTVTILDGPDAADLNIRLFQQMQQGLPTPPRPGYLQWYGAEKSIEEFRDLMVQERRLIYEFAVGRSYGMY